MHMYIYIYIYIYYKIMLLWQNLATTVYSPVFWSILSKTLWPIWVVKTSKVSPDQFFSYDSNWYHIIPFERHICIYIYIYLKMNDTSNIIIFNISYDFNCFMCVNPIRWDTMYGSEVGWEWHISIQSFQQYMARSYISVTVIHNLFYTYIICTGQTLHEFKK